MLDAYDVMDAAADEIERLKAELAASQAREAKLREALEALAKLGNGCVFGSSLGNQMAFNAFCLPYDDTALQEAIKQGQRAVAEHILEMWRDPWPRTERSFFDRLEAYAEELK
jgi:hypothetical protein